MASTKIHAHADSTPLTVCFSASLIRMPSTQCFKVGIVGGLQCAMLLRYKYSKVTWSNLVLSTPRTPSIMNCKTDVLLLHGQRRVPCQCIHMPGGCSLLHIHPQHMFRHFANCSRDSLLVQCAVGVSPIRALLWSLAVRWVCVLQGGGGVRPFSRPPAIGKFYVRNGQYLGKYLPICCIRTSMQIVTDMLPMINKKWRQKVQFDLHLRA